MTSYIRSIRGIERTNVYVPVQAVSPYAFYPYRDGEPQLPPDSGNDWNQVYQQAANSAAAWVQTVKQAQFDIDQLTGKLSSQLNAGNPIDDSTQKLTALLNQLESHFKEHAENLKPELWASIDLALRHPAAQKLSLRRSPHDGRWIMDEYADKSPKLPLSSDEARHMKRLLLGSDGLLNNLKHALAYDEQQKAVDLLQPQLTNTLPYAAYYGSMQSYLPLPRVGLVLNRYM